ncbi:hypothetical protein GUITHDRAFT_106127 [Guillardia theta CCMP2712]|uniref:C2 domain-containing protein n=1 Tax=Guillardia theta (strain CCMP2712) TaxID=905079 RepID=L1JIX6_GUITC|nr:hypothetical protein GUITHDRAFT_106127 [Guillardia theta CCMP2712]EKX48045.1 hypothetical protein GUITHDRAFT_106127 [Guillardia theta CCMP2712]|eukprot:XP_005835025.1 hypothetical protein GUITHDRAFT_106127 [Guillardia theta CCMP2712]
MGRREEEEEEEEAARPDLTAEEEQSLSPATGRDEPGGQATLVVKVLEGKELMAADRSGTSDPYAIVEYGRAKKQTRTVKKDLNPEWNETFYLDFNAKAEKVSIEVYDYDLIGSHDFLGRVEISMSEMKMEAVVQDWFDLKVTCLHSLAGFDPTQPRPSKNEIVSGSLHLYLAIIPKDREADLNLGLDAHSWLDLDSFRAKGHERKYHTIRMYFASTFADFQVEFESLYTSVFPKLSTLCQLHGYEFIPVVMRYGMDERMDKMYALDPRVARLCFHEIAECRRISPRANFCALIGDRYGSSPLPPSLDKNEYMAILSHVEEQKEEELYQLLERWHEMFMPLARPLNLCRYKLDENQSPNRVLLQSADGKISPSAGPGTSEHKEWESIERKLFEGLYKSSKQVLLVTILERM